MAAPTALIFIPVFFTTFSLFLHQPDFPSCDPKPFLLSTRSDADLAAPQTLRHSFPRTAQQALPTTHRHPPRDYRNSSMGIHLLFSHHYSPFPSPEATCAADIFFLLLPLFFAYAWKLRFKKGREPFFSAKIFFPFHSISPFTAFKCAPLSHFCPLVPPPFHDPHSRREICPPDPLRPAHPFYTIFSFHVRRSPPPPRSPVPSFVAETDGRPHICAWTP